MFKKIYITILILAFCHSCAFAIDEIKEGTTLSMQDCIDIAIEKSPQVQIYKQYIEMQEAVVGQSKSSYFPSLGASVGYEFTNSGSRYRSSHNNNSSAKIALNQLIYSFGKVLFLRQILSNNPSGTSVYFTFYRLSVFIKPSFDRTSLFIHFS